MSSIFSSSDQQNFNEMLQGPIFACLTALLVLTTPSFGASVAVSATSGSLSSDVANKEASVMDNTVDIEEWVKQKKAELEKRRLVGGVH